MLLLSRTTMRLLPSGTNLLYGAEGLLSSPLICQSKGRYGWLVVIHAPAAASVKGRIQFSLPMSAYTAKLGMT